MAKTKFPQSLKARLLFFVFAVAFAPLIIVTFISLRYTEQMTKRILYSHLHNITQNKAKAIARWFSERTTDVRVIADSKALKSMNTYEIESFLESMRTHYLDYKRIVLVDSKGNIVADTADIMENYQGANWFQKAIEQGEYISDIFWENDELMFLIATTVGKDDQIGGVLCEFIGLEYLINLATDMALGKSGESYLVNKDGIIIAHKDKGHILKDRVNNFDLLMELSERGHGLEVYQNYRGIEVMGVQAWVSHQKIGNFRLPQWSLFAEQEAEEVFAGIGKYRIGIIILFMLLSFVIIFGCFLISWTIIRPIRKLASATTAISKGDFNQQLETDRMDELGRLTVAFNDMAQQLRSFYAGLEDRITRTRGELEKTSIELEKSKDALYRSAKLIALGQVSAGIAHEIRTPLTSIKLFIQSLETTLSSDIETIEDFAIIKREINRMEDIINRFLGFARPAEPKFENANINHIISDIVPVIEAHIKNRKITIETEYDDGLPFISGDKRQLEQVFLNMLLNSIDAMRDGGKILVTTGIINVSEGHRKLLRIGISDTGCGIEPESIKYIFDPFFTTKDSGTGMGLAIAFTVVEQHGGLIEVESEPSKGTKFTIYLPIDWGAQIG